MHLPQEPRDALFARLADAVAKGGSLLIIGHRPADLQTSAPRPPMPELIFNAAEVAAKLGPEHWTVLIGQARARAAADPARRPISTQEREARTVADGVL